MTIWGKLLGVGPMDVCVSTRVGFESFWYSFFVKKVLVEELVP